MPDIHIKRGASLNLHFALQNDDGTPYPLDTTTVVTSDVCDIEGNLVRALAFTADPTTPGLLYTQVDDTSAWPIGQLRCDIALTDQGLTLISDTFAIYVDQPVTRLPPAAPA
jgi:hypothetical protein